jgi:hypothetical protein
MGAPFSLTFLRQRSGIEHIAAESHDPMSFVARRGSL